MGAALWVDPYSNARREADAWRSTDPVRAERMSLRRWRVQPRLWLSSPSNCTTFPVEPTAGGYAIECDLQVSADGNPKVYRGTIGYIAPRAEFTPKSVETENLRTDLVYQVRATMSRLDAVRGSPSADSPSSRRSRGATRP